jgi:hypothetical protein
MSALFKYVIVPLCLLATGFYAYGSLNGKTFEALNGEVFQSAYREVSALMPARRETAADPIDPASAANIDEELDYLVARRLGSLAGWRAFLSAHGSGVHAEFAKAELDLLLAGKENAPDTAEASDGATLGEKAASKDAAETAVASIGPEEICRRDEDRLARLRSRPTRDEAMRFAGELACQRLWPQLLNLIEKIGAAPPAPTDEEAHAFPADAQPASETAPPSSPASTTDVPAPAGSATVSEANRSPANAEAPSRAMPAAPVTEVAAPSQAEEATQDPHSDGKGASGTSPSSPSARGTAVAALAASAAVSEATSSPANAEAPSRAMPAAPVTEVAAPS